MVAQDYYESNVVGKTKVMNISSVMARMSTFGTRLLEAREEQKLTQEQLAERSGVSQGLIAHIESGRNTGSKHIVALARALGLNSAWLAEGKKPKKATAANLDPGPDIKGRVPIISWVQAGDFASVVDNFHPGHADEWEETVVPIHRHTYALRVKGPSMTTPSGEEPTFPHGQVIIVEPDLVDEPDKLIGRLVIVRRQGEDEATFKRLIKDGGRFLLQPLNPQFDVLELREGDVICGVVREKRVRYV